MLSVSDICRADRLDDTEGLSARENVLKWKDSVEKSKAANAISRRKKLILCMLSLQYMCVWCEVCLCLVVRLVLPQFNMTHPSLSIIFYFPINLFTRIARAMMKILAKILLLLYIESIFAKRYNTFH